MAAFAATDTAPGAPQGGTGRGRQGVWKLAWAVAVVLAAVAALAAAVWSVPAAPRPLCGQLTAARPALRHVIIVMLENRSYSQLAGSPAAPFQARLARECGNATEAFAVTHGSAPNYLAVSAGQYPSSSVSGSSGRR